MRQPATATALAAALLGAWLAFPASEGRARADEPAAVSLATGGVAGVYFPLGEAMAAAWSEAIDSLTVTAEPTGGSVVNVQMVQSGEAALALAQNDIASHAVNAAEMFAGEPPLDGNLGVAVLYPEVVQIVTLRDSGIADVEDLVGNRVAVGSVGSGTEANARQILEAHGIGYDDLAAHLLGFDEAVVALRDGIIQAAFLTAGIPTGAVVDLVTTYGHDIEILPIAADRAEAIAERWPFYSAITIPAGTYAGLEADVPTVTVLAMLVASADLDAETVERLLEVLYSDATLERLCAIHARGCDISRETATEAMPIPMHPGAESFFSRGG